jgi:hypothetical protein
MKKFILLSLAVVFLAGGSFAAEKNEVRDPMLGSFLGADLNLYNSYSISYYFKRYTYFIDKFSVSTELCRVERFPRQDGYFYLNEGDKSVGWILPVRCSYVFKSSMDEFKGFLAKGEGNAEKKWNFAYYIYAGAGNPVFNKDRYYGAGVGKLMFKIGAAAVYDISLGYRKLYLGPAESEEVCLKLDMGFGNYWKINESRRIDAGRGFSNQGNARKFSAGKKILYSLLGSAMVAGGENMINTKQYSGYVVWFSGLVLISNVLDGF